LLVLSLDQSIAARTLVHQLTLMSREAAAGLPTASPTADGMLGGELFGNRIVTP
jgi:hypothetical protein